MVCKFCNQQIKNNSVSCKYCGNVVSPYVETTPNKYYDYNYTYQKQKSSNLLIVVIICISAILLITVVAGIFMIKTKNSSDTSSNTTTKVAIESDKTEPDKIFNRFQTFSTSYTYQKFPELINSIPASDEECFEMKEFIEHYNDLWMELVNNKDLSIVHYVRGNSGPRKDIDKYYNNNDVTEEFELFEVHDVRKLGSNYYIWTHEKITKYSLYKTEHIEHHWIYKVAEDSDGHYVETYIADPHYK